MDDDVNVLMIRMSADYYLSRGDLNATVTVGDAVVQRSDEKGRMGVAVPARVN